MEIQIIQNKIHEIRGQRVMLDFDLAAMYEVETRVLKQAVKRNLKRFPIDFMFTLTNQEIETMVSQNVIPSKSVLGGALPFAFSEQGVSMLSSVLRSDTAIDINISIIRAFVMMRQYLSDYKEIKDKITQIETEMQLKFNDIHQALNYLLQKDQQDKEQKERKRIGFK